MTFLLKLATTSLAWLFSLPAMLSQLALAGETASPQGQPQSILATGIYIGVLSALLLNLLVIRTRYFKVKMNFFYAAYCLCLMMGAAFEGRLLDSWLPATISWNQAFIVAMLGSAVFFNSFQREFLEIKRHDIMMDRVLVALCWGNPIVIILVVLFPQIDPLSAMAWYTLPNVSALIVGTWRAWRRQAAQLGSFVLGASFLGLGTLVWAAGTFGVLPPSVFTAHGIHVGSAFEIFILFVAMGKQVAVQNLAAQTAEAAAVAAQLETEHAMQLSSERERTARLEEMGFTSMKIADRVNTPLSIIRMSLEELNDLVQSADDATGRLDSIAKELEYIDLASKTIGSEVKDLHAHFKSFGTNQDMSDSYETRLGKILSSAS